MPADSKPKQVLDIDQLKRKHKDLERQKTTAEANLQTATQMLDALKQEARQRYGTDNLDELRQRLAQMKEANQKKQEDYQKHLEELESQLTEVERDFANPAAERQ